MPTEPQDSFWWRLVHLDPALVRGLVIAAVALMGTAGILVSHEVSDGLIGVWVAVMALVQALWTRGAVTANARVVVRAPDPVNAPDVVVPGDATTTATPAEIIEAARIVPADQPVD